jgi:hypothetical protein
MTAEVEALLERLDDISSRSGHEWNAAKDAAALIRAQAEEIYKWKELDRVTQSAFERELKRAEAAEAKLAAAARQEQASYWMIEQRVNGCQEWLKGLRHHVAGEVVAIWTEFADHAIHFQSKQFAEEVGGLGVFVTSRLPCLTSAYITEHMDISANSLVAPVPTGDAVSVPAEPTAAMNGAGDGVISNEFGIGKGTWIAAKVWKAMIQVRPK